MKINFIALLLLFCLCFALPASGSENLWRESNLHVIADTDDISQMPLLNDNHLYIPLEDILNTFSNGYRWSPTTGRVNKDTKSVLFTFFQDYVQFTVNSNTAIINGESKYISTPVLKKDGRLWISTDALKETLGLEIIQDTKSNTLRMLACTWKGLPIVPDYSKRVSVIAGQRHTLYGPVLVVDVEKGNYTALENMMETKIPDFKVSEYEANNTAKGNAVIRSYTNKKSKQETQERAFQKYVNVLIENNKVVNVDVHIDLPPEYYNTFKKTRYVKQYGDSKGTTYTDTIFVDPEKSGYSKLNAFLKQNIKDFVLEDFDIKVRQSYEYYFLDYYYKDQKKNYLDHSVINVTIKDGYVQVIYDNLEEKEEMEKQKLILNTQETDEYTQCISKYFDIKLYSQKTYSPSEDIRPYAEVTYIGPDDSITVEHSDPCYGFGIHGGIYELGNFINDVGMTSIWKRGEVQRFEFIKGGGWSGDDPLASFWEEYFSIKECYLPPDKYTVYFNLDVTVAEKDSFDTIKIDQKIERDILVQ